MRLNRRNRGESWPSTNTIHQMTQPLSCIPMPPEHAVRAAIGTNQGNEVVALFRREAPTRTIRQTRHGFQKFNARSSYPATNGNGMLESSGCCFRRGNERKTKIDRDGGRKRP